ncbi:EAL domain-containing protein [Pontibacterium granulatum]|uniref:sensor domain-containing protein n=1 Tax=Pontibacterium granulatum TaxID=2036029 RepID=UPI00249B8979|nr:EAL domain-containing protein [Pontibacterium granulatum]MDI3323257.1 EAL domain-containing protein [Pontibacterium granulatum]
MSSPRDLNIGVSKKPFIAWVGVIASAVLVMFTAVLWFSFNQAVHSRNVSAELYTRMVEGSVTRTIESLEISLISIVDELADQAGHKAQHNDAQARIEQILRFAPHIRQITIVKNDEIWLDSAGRMPGQLNMALIGCDTEQKGNFDSDLKIGLPVSGRFLPLIGNPEPASKRRLIPFGLNYTDIESGDEYKVIAALNPAYLNNFITELDLGINDNLYLLNFDADALLMHGEYDDHRVQVSSLLQKLVTLGQDEIALATDAGYIPEAYTTVRLSEKYSLAVALNIDHYDTFVMWRSENSALFSGLLLAAVVILLSAVGLIISYRRSLAMREQVHLLSAAIQQSSIATVITNEQREIQYVNEAFTRLFGYKLGELIGKTPAVLQSELTDESVYAALEEKLIDAKPWQGEFINRDKQGDLITVESNIFPVQHLHGEDIHYICMLNDIRERKDAEEHIRLLSRVVEHSPTIVVITDPDGHIEYVNPKFEEVTGYSKEEVLGENPRILKSGETEQEEYEHLWQVISNGGVWVGDLHNKRKDGSLYWERANIGSIKDDKGEVIHYVAIKEIITQLKEDEKQLRLASAVFQTAAEAIMVTDADNKIQMVNPSFASITGYEEAEVLGRKPSILKSGKHAAHFYENIHNALAARGFWEGEIWNKRKNGEIYPKWQTISAMLDAEGQVEGYVSLFNDITERKKNEELILQQANFDALTGLPNRNLFADRLSQALSRAGRLQQRGALLFIDLDRFKLVNDTLGHSAGDLLLQETSVRIKDCLRRSDTAARLGGDEFAIIIPEIQKLSDVQEVAHKILDRLAQPFMLDEHEAFVSGSIGITIFPDDGRESEVLVRNADSAMYKSKEQGRNTYQFYTAEMNEAALRKRELENALHQALRKQEFSLLYQPIWNICTGTLEAVEALIRWHHPQRGLISPADFIPVAEEVGLITNIGEWVLNEASRFGVELSQLSDEPPKISVNVSSRQIQRVDVAELTQQVLQSSGLPGSQLIVEITESILIEDERNTHQQLERLRDMDVEIAIDDFGTGYSSLSYLKKYPITRLKIDRSFVQDVGKDVGDHALVSGIISMADSLSLKVIAEGVETREQVELIREMGCYSIQGYYFDRPLPAEALKSLLIGQKAAETLC